MSESTLKRLEMVVVADLTHKSSITHADIVEAVKMYCCLPAYTGVSATQAESLIREIESRYNVTVNVGGVLRNKAHEPWLDAAKAEIKPYFWDRYQTHLLQENGFPKPVVTRIGDVTDRVLGLMQDPRSAGPWDRRGLVVGHVQSGKTANYTGLACKAADAGYRLIVIIAGIHNNLRNQTQERIDEGFVGFDSARLHSGQRDKTVGVGRIDASRRPATFTNSNRDFSAGTANAVGLSLGDLNEPAVLVIKKNTATLRNLIGWLATHNADNTGKTVDLPMLLIDDEADNASINVKYGKGVASTINALIRELLQLFARSSYVGYTATPFANIFIDPDTDDEMLGEDLFPRDFIVSLDAPNNYFGAAKVFTGAEGGPVRHVSDSEEVLPLKHKIDHEVASLPASMLHAVRTFILARAIRLTRGQAGKHNSMLINASRFTAVQSRMALRVAEYLDEVQAALRIHGGLASAAALRNRHISELEQSWEAEYAGLGVVWEEVFGVLHEAAAPIRVVEINSRSSAALDYRNHEGNGLNVIAVGGLSLSRGLTLEGLIVSYFLRNSLMYDTLMQMARWFGYRPGYEDLCRIWMPDDAAGWYEHIAESIELLRRDLREMEAAGATPMEFGLRVRSHPDSLIVTARNKMGSGKKITASVGLANRFVETITIKDDPVARAKNLDAAEQLVRRIQELGRRAGPEVFCRGGSHLFVDVPASAILDFLREFDNDPRSLLSDPRPVAEYVERRADSELARWDVAVLGRMKQEDATNLAWDLAGLHVICQQRTCGKDSTIGNKIVIGSRNRVASRGDESYGLTDDERESAREAYCKHEVAEGRIPGENIPDWAFRAVRKGRPLLLLHLLDMREVDEGGNRSGGPAENGGSSRKSAHPIHPDAPSVAWSLSLPKTDLPNATVKYVVSTVWVRENMAIEQTDEDDYDDDAE